MDGIETGSLGESLEQLQQTINENGLGPAEVSYDDEFLWVRLTGDTQAHTLAKWPEMMEVVDMTTGKYHSRDPRQRLHLRGHLDGNPVVVTATWPVTAPEITVVDRLLPKQDPTLLLRELMRLESEGGRG